MILECAVSHTGKQYQHQTRATSAFFFTPPSVVLAEHVAARSSSVRSFSSLRRTVRCRVMDSTQSRGQPLRSSIASECSSAHVNRLFTSAKTNRFFSLVAAATEEILSSAPSLNRLGHWKSSCQIFRRLSLSPPFSVWCWAVTRRSGQAGAARPPVERLVSEEASLQTGA